MGLQLVRTGSSDDACPFIEENPYVGERDPQKWHLKGRAPRIGEEDEEKRRGWKKKRRDIAEGLREEEERQPGQFGIF